VTELAFVALLTALAVCYIEHALAMSFAQEASSQPLDPPDDPMEVDPAPLPALEGLPFPGALANGAHEVVHPAPLTTSKPPLALPALESLPFPGALVNGAHEVVHWEM
jgi:hypothetical protein